MIRRCEKCTVAYDDATCWTICPHEPFISDRDARRKDLAFSLTQKTVRYKGSEDTLHIQSIDSRGYVTFRERGMEGEYDPTGLEVVE